MWKVLSGLLALLLFRRYGLHPQLAIEFIFCSLLLIIAMIDLDTGLIPDILSLPGIVLGLALSFLTPRLSWWDSLLGIILGGGIFYLIARRVYAHPSERGTGRGRYKAARDDRGFPRVEGGRIYHSGIVGFRHDYCFSTDVAIRQRPWLRIAVRPLSGFWRRVVHLFGPAFLSLVLFRSARDVGRNDAQVLLCARRRPGHGKSSSFRRTSRDSWRPFCGQKRENP